MQSALFRLLKTADTFPHSPALVTPQASYSYHELLNSSANYARALNQLNCGEGVLILASKTLSTYAGNDFVQAKTQYRNKVLWVHKVALTATSEFALSPGEFIVQNDKLYCGCADGILELQSFQVIDVIDAELENTKLINSRSASCVI